MKNKGKQSDIKKELLTNKKSNRLKWTALAVLSVLVACLVALMIFIQPAFFLKRIVSAKTENFKVDSAMMSYFLYEEYREFINENYASIEQYNLKNDISLKKQSCCLLDNEASWFDYFKDKAKKTVKKQLLFAEGAKKAKISLSHSDRRNINKKVEQIKDAAERNHRTEKEQLEFLYGKGVDFDTVERCLELEFLSNRFYDTAVAGKIDTSDAAMNELFEEYRQKAVSCDFIRYTVEADYDADKATTQEKEAAFLRAKEKAEKVAQLDKTSFVNIVTDGQVTALEKTYGTKVTQKQRQEIYNSMANVGFNFDGSELAKWCFDESRKTEDTLVLREENGYSVYKMQKTAYREDYVTKNIRVIVTTAEKYGGIDKAYQEIAYVYKDWQASDKSVVSFENLAYKYSEDTKSNLNGGLYKNVEHYEFESEAESWIFDKNRSSGDCEVIKTNEKCYLVYFVGNGLARWKTGIYEAVLEKNTESVLNELSQQTEVKFFDKQIARVKL